MALAGAGRTEEMHHSALTLGRLTTVQTLAGFDFAFQPSLDRHRILVLAELIFVDRAALVVTNEATIPQSNWLPRSSRLDRLGLVNALKRGVVVEGATLSNPAPVLSVRRRAVVAQEDRRLGLWPNDV